MKKTWILVANGERARCFERHGKGLPLTELADFVHPSLSLAERASGGDHSGAAGKGHGRTGHAGTQFEPHTAADEKERSDFARLLADYLNRGVAGQRCDELVLIATGPMLGALRPGLSPAADKLLGLSVASDLTHYQGSELKQRIDHALELPN